MPTKFTKLCICLRKFQQNLIKSKKRAKYFHICFLNKLKKMYKKLKKMCEKLIKNGKKNWNKKMKQINKKVEKQKKMRIVFSQFCFEQIEKNV